MVQVIELGVRSQQRCYRLGQWYAKKGFGWLTSALWSDVDARVATRFAGQDEAQLTCYGITSLNCIGAKDKIWTSGRYVGVVQASTRYVTISKNLNIHRTVRC